MILHRIMVLYSLPEFRNGEDTWKPETNYADFFSLSIRRVKPQTREILHNRLYIFDIGTGMVKEMERYLLLTLQPLDDGSIPETKRKVKISGNLVDVLTKNAVSKETVLMEIKNGHDEAHATLQYLLKTSKGTQLESDFMDMFRKAGSFDPRTYDTLKVQIKTVTRF